MAEQVMVLDSDSVGSEELHNVECSSRISCNTTRATIPIGITGQEARRAIARMFTDRQQKIKVSKAVRVLQDTMQKI